MKTSLPSRRSFLQFLAMLAAGGQALWHTRDVQAAIETAKDAAASAVPWPEMTYRTLGRTGYNASRLVFGCGAALSRQPRDELLERAFEAGVNVFDVGTRRYYDAAERNMRNFVARHRDEIFLISKALTGIDAGPDDEISVAEARKAAQTWTTALEESLTELGTDHLDAYYQMGVNNPNMVRSEGDVRSVPCGQAGGEGVALRRKHTRERRERTGSGGGHRLVQPSDDRRHAGGLVRLEQPKAARWHARHEGESVRCSTKREPRAWD